jgi:phosphocarrier protein
MISKKVVIKNPTGLHLRPAGVLCKVAMRYKSQITFTVGDTTANAKSVLSVLGSGVRCGDELEFTCSGSDEAEALKGMIESVENGLGEL